MSELQIARQAAADAQANEKVKKMILSGDYDAWPNVQAALNALRLAAS